MSDWTRFKRGFNRLRTMGKRDKYVDVTNDEWAAENPEWAERGRRYNMPIREMRIVAKHEFNGEPVPPGESSYGPSSQEAEVLDKYNDKEEEEKKAEAAAAAKAETTRLAAQEEAAAAAKAEKEEEDWEEEE